MEYVDGIRIDEYCDLHRLSMRRRIEVLLETLEAIEYAHRHLVIHADLKPSNILVTTEGKSRLLDFGVATVLSEQLVDQPTSARYTELYASPEQRAGQRLTIACDIYAVGLIAQIVLTGQQPEAAAIGSTTHSAKSQSIAAHARVLKALPSESLEKLAAARDTTTSNLIASIRGDIEAILTKALQPNPQDRFHSVQEMSDELRRHLLGYPILTRPAGWPKQIRKWVLRNKLAASFALVFLSVLVLSVVGVVYQSTAAARKREIAKTRLHDLVRLTDALAGELYSSVHGLQGSGKAQDALLTSAHQTIDKLAARETDDPELAIELANEYEKLAKLELSRDPRTPETLRRSIDDLNKGITILSRVPRRDHESERARQQMQEMTRLRSTLLPAQSAH
jgi:hypothetical protein